jgi:hypothetical protein
LSGIGGGGGGELPNVSIHSNLFLLFGVSPFIVMPLRGILVFIIEFCSCVGQVHGFPRIMGVLTHLDTFKNNKALQRTKKNLKQRFWTEVYQELPTVHSQIVQYHVVPSFFLSTTRSLSSRSASFEKIKEKKILKMMSLSLNFFMFYCETYH